ncbi:hypothetical protein MTR_6g452410 [Medicago truncatula]|uniref:Uncharacterized protein n=1 Tax=Medicago truncatula TaxID=3880 RepID=A0A072UKE7_MEDTR|nr:hypothetical protein MTR_6g452410 [Medicago truncatula]
MYNLAMELSKLKSQEDMEDIGIVEAFNNANLGITKKPVHDFRCLMLISLIVLFSEGFAIKWSGCGLALRSEKRKNSTNYIQELNERKYMKNLINDL